MKTFKPFLNVLPVAQQKLLQTLRPAQDLRFVLYGGTAIALQIGHRTSVDFDFFTDQSLDRKKLKSTFSFFEKSTVLQDQADSLTISVPIDSESVKVSFFGNITFGRVQDPLTTDNGILQVASLDDLMAHKLKVILQRSEAKDYQDIAAMVQAKISLELGLASAVAMYGNSFQPSESLKACVYFNDGDLNTLASEVKKILIATVGNIKKIPVAHVISKALHIS